jgi:hypothetical protein
METRTQIQNALVETSGAREAVLFANTPSYILSRIRKDASAAYVAETLSAEQILEGLRNMLETPDADVHRLVRVYVYLVSLALKEDVSKFSSELRSLNLSGVQWARQIADSILSEQTPITTETVNIDSDNKPSVIKNTTITTGIVSIGG